LVFTPAVDIFETDQQITLVADMPGTTAEDISIDLREGVLTIAAEVKPWEMADEKDVLIEFEIGKYYRQFSLSDKIDQAKIDAQLKDGVLKLALPKSAETQPRKINVTSG
jgi:HSP20 family protein